MIAYHYSVSPSKVGAGHDNNNICTWHVAPVVPEAALLAPGPHLLSIEGLQPS